MNNKLSLVTLAILACTSVQSVEQYPKLTNNYDDVVHADMNELRSHYQYTKGDPFARYANGGKLIYTPKNKTPASLDSINKPPLQGFVKATDHLDMAVINKFRHKHDADTIYYIVKDKIAAIKSKGHLDCEYKLKLDSYHGDKYYHSLKGLKDSYLSFTSSNGYNVKPFIDEKYLQGFIKDKNGYDSGSIRVLIKGRVLTLSVFDCSQTKAKEQIVKDLTEWAELLIEANY
jgi:hypothetical protein